LRFYDRDSLARVQLPFFFAASFKGALPRPRYLATSFSEEVACGFAMRAYHAGEGDQPAVLYTILVRPYSLICKYIRRPARRAVHGPGAAQVRPGHRLPL
jgi:hypothetical protein